MLRLLSNILGLQRRDLVIVKVALLLFFVYLPLLTVSFGFFSIAKLPIIIVLGVTILLYNLELSKNRESYDSFEDDNLFFRRGEVVSNLVLPIRYSRNLTNEETEELMSEMIEEIKTAIREEIDHRIVTGKHTTEIVTIKDKRKPTDVRDFLRFSYIGSRGGELTNFINFQYIGNYTVINFTTYVKGIPHWYDKLDFLLMSPVRFWFWIVPWLRKSFSITSSISKYLDNSFEELDIRDYYHASRYSILDSVRDFLDQRDLLDEVLKTMIFMQLINNNYGNQANVNVNGSGNNLGNIAQTAMKSMA